MNTPLSLNDLVSIAELQEMQDSFSEVANVSLRTADPSGHFLTTMSNAPALCTELLRNGTVATQAHRSCLPTFLGGEGIVDEEFSYECIPGLRHYLIPLKVTLTGSKSMILGYMVVGPVIFMKRRDKNAYADVAEMLHIDVDQLWDYILEVRVFSYKAIRSFLDMVGNLTCRILNLAYAKLMMQRRMGSDLAAEAIFESASQAPGIQDFLELFLDLVMDITNGTRGSVMLLDRRTRRLNMRAAHNIPTDVIPRVSLGLGEGVAGLSAQTKRAFLINDITVDPLVADRLTQPHLFSSLVVPIKSGEDVYGVLNVSSDRSTPVRFDESTLALVTRAACVAGVALQRFQ